MKQFVGAGLLGLILLLIGCDSSPSTPVAQQVATLAPAPTSMPEPTSAATKTATPTNISPTATHEPAFTQTSTLTQTSTPQPTQELLITRNFDWNVYHFPEDEFSVSVPVDWYYVELNEEQLREFFENTDAPTISLSILYGNDSYPGYFNERLQFLAISGNNHLAVEILKEKIPSAYQQLPPEYALQTYVDLSLTNAQFRFEGKLEYVREALSLNDWPAIRVVYETINIGDPYHLLEYYVAVKGQFYLLSFISWNERWEHDLALFGQIAQSFQSTLSAPTPE